MRRDGSSPADDFLLEQEKEPRRLQELADIAIRFEKLALTGRLVPPDEINDLGGDLFEIKGRSWAGIRLPFYYRRDHSHIRAIRITSGFIKSSMSTQRRHKNFARMIWSEDLER